MTWGLRATSLAAVLALTACNSEGDGAGFSKGPLLGLLTSEQDVLIEDAAEKTAQALGVSAPVDETIAVVCDLPKSKMGKKVDASPEKGRATYELFDTKPGTTEQRSFYVTGFDDGCARRVTASLVMFGSVELYEMVKFSGLVDVPGTPTDEAYGRLRQSTCGSAKKPCTGNGLKTIARQTAFVQAFPRKGSATHLELLLHNGTLAATAKK